jgi:hypothetical protein
LTSKYNSVSVEEKGQDETTNKCDFQSIKDDLNASIPVCIVDGTTVDRQVSFYTIDMHCSEM